MTPEEQLDEARAKEADRLWGEAESRVGELSALQVAARLARENWTPPEPEPVVDPDILAFREWLVEQWPDLQEEATSGETDSIIPARAYLAGARMAREQERERARPLVEYVTGDALRSAARRWSVARQILAKYQGEA